MDRRLGAIGDSAVVEALGLGAMQISSAPEQLKVFKDVLPVNYQARCDFLKMGNHYDFNKATPKIGIAIRSINNFESGLSLHLVLSTGLAILVALVVEFMIHL